MDSDGVGKIRQKRGQQGNKPYERNPVRKCNFYDKFHSRIPKYIHIPFTCCSHNKHTKTYKRLMLSYRHVIWKYSVLSAKPNKEASCLDEIFWLSFHDFIVRLALAACLIVYAVAAVPPRRNCSPQATGPPIYFKNIFVNNDVNDLWRTPDMRDRGSGDLFKDP